MSFDPHQADLDFSILEAVINGCGGSLERSWAGYESRELDRFKVFRHMVPETINSIIAERKKQYPGIHKLGTDMAVPDGHMREMWDLYRSRCEALQLEWCAFGHIGNNHIHVNILPRNLEELEKGMQLYEVFAQERLNLAARSQRSMASARSSQVSQAYVHSGTNRADETRQESPGPAKFVESQRHFSG